MNHNSLYKQFKHVVTAFERHCMSGAA